MRSSLNDGKIRRIVRRLLELLSDEKICREIDAPIDQVSESFTFIEEESPSSERFHEIIAEFVRRLYGKALRFKRILSREEALTEAIFLLEIGYKGRSANGYDAALHNASEESNGGMGEVLRQIADCLKGIERDKYMRRVLRRSMGTFDWQTKCRMTAFLKDSLFIRENPPVRSVEDLAENWEDLFLMYREVEDSDLQ